MNARLSGPRGLVSSGAVVLAGLGLAACQSLIGADFDAAHERGSDQSSGAGCGAGGAGCGDAGAFGAGRAGASEPHEPGGRGGATTGDSGGGTSGGRGDDGSIGGAPPTGANPDLHSGTRRLDAHGTDVAVVSRRPGLLDVFAVSGGRIAFNRYDGQQWSPAEYLGGPDASVPTARLSAVAAAFNPDRIDVFAVGEDGSVYHWHSSPSAGALEWFGPEYLASACPARPSAGIGVASWGLQRIDAFWICPSGSLGHVWGSGDALTNIETGDDESIYYLRPPAPVAWASRIKVVSSAFGRLDLFMLSASGRGLLHHWYTLQENSYWGPPQRPNAELLITGTPGDGAVLDGLVVANGREGLDLFLRFRAARSELRRLRYRGGAWATPAPGEAMPELDALGAARLPSIFDTLSWSPPALDIFGADADGRIIDVWLGDYHSP